MQGLIAPVSIQSAGYVNAPFTLTIVITLSSSGCRNASITEVLNSVISSRNNTPFPANVISPGFGIVPPPISAELEIL